MPTPPLLLLLLLLGSVAADEGFIRLLEETCGGRAHVKNVVQAVQCSVPPCSRWKGSVSLALPVLLSLHTNTSLMHVTGRLYDDQGEGRGLLDVFPEGEEGVVVRGASCGSELQPARACREGQWVHVTVVAAGQHLHLTINNVSNQTHLTFHLHHHHHHLPTVLHVTCVACGYSALTVTTTLTTTTTTTTTSTTTTSTNTMQTNTTTTTTYPVVVAITTLVAMSMVGSVALVVMVWWGWRGLGPLVQVV